MISAVGDGIFEPIVNQANDAIIVAETPHPMGPGFRIVYVNATFSKMFGYGADEVLGRSPRMLQGPGTCVDTIVEISATIHRGGSIRRRILNYSKSGHPVWVEVSIVPLPTDDEKTRRFAAIERDVTEQVIRERELEELAFFDPLTKLGNRRHFRQTLEREMSRARRTAQPLSLAFADLDLFKTVNDTWGHPAGDRVLAAIARSLVMAVRNYDCVARIGGEEFALILPGLAAGDALAMTDRVRRAVAATASVTNCGRPIRITCSIGVTTVTAHDAPDDACARADRALYLAKQGGRNRVCQLSAEQPPADRQGAANR